jgi:hypothetical protein
VRQAEFTEELARQTEKDRLRKEYIEELQVSWGVM